MILPDARLASVGEYNDISLWPNGAGKPADLKNFSIGRTRSLAMLLDGRLASGDTDGRIKLWPKDSAGEPVVLTHGSGVWALAVLPDGRLASGGADGSIKLWLVDEKKMIAALCLRAGRNLSTDEWAKYIGPDVPWQPSCRGVPSNWRTP